MKTLIFKVPFLKLSIKSKEKIVDLICYAFILLFLYAGSSKLFDYANFKLQLSKSPITTHFASMLSWLVPSIEIVISILLLIRRTIKISLYASFALMIVFTSYVIVILNFSDFIPCSCGGVLQNMDWDQHLIFNVFFTIMAATGILVQSGIPRMRGGQNYNRLNSLL